MTFAEVCPNPTLKVTERTFRILREELVRQGTLNGAASDLAYRWSARLAEEGCLLGTGPLVKRPT